MENTKAGKSKNAQGQGKFKKRGKGGETRKEAGKEGNKNGRGGANIKEAEKRSKYKTKTEQIQK